jgi:hypothetical protein
MSRIVVHRYAARYLQRLPKGTKQRIKNVLQQLEQKPLDIPGVKHMAGIGPAIIGYGQESIESSIGSMIKKILFTLTISAPEGMCISECGLYMMGTVLQCAPGVGPRHHIVIQMKYSQ